MKATTAQVILARSENYLMAQEACESMALEIGQDIEGETTIYTFEDDSQVEDCNGVLRAL